MTVKLPKTQTLFAPAERVTVDQLRDQERSIVQAEFVQYLLNSMQDLVLILNGQRQIIAVNKRLLETFGVIEPESLIGLRPGEALGCVHACDSPGGCGTGRNCSVCGAVLTILTSQRSAKQARGECRVVLERNGGTALDLQVMATPITVSDHSFTIFSIRDVSDDKRRTILERVFFHDILNTAGGIHGLAALLATDDIPAEKAEKFKDWMVSLSDTLIDEIQHHKQLLAAERGELKPVFEQVELTELLDEIYRLYSHHERTPGRILELSKSLSIRLTTDRTILRRIVGNMVMNAMEATKAGDRIEIQASTDNGNITIMVTNPGSMSSEVQLNMFNRSFSTMDSAGRGIGTYSMKLFGERYLGGEVGFRSQNNQTSFFITLPVQISN